MNNAVSTTSRNSLWVITRGQRTRYSLALIAMGMASVFTIVAPLVGMYALDVVVYQDFSLGTNVLVSLTRELSGSDSFTWYLWLSAAAGVVLTLLAGVFSFLKSRWAAIASEALAQRLRDELFGHLHRLPAAFFDNADSGDLVQRCTSDVETIRVFLQAHVVEIGRAVLLLFAMLPVLFWRDYRLAWLSICLMPLLGVGAFVFFRRIKTLFEITDASEGALTAVLKENLTGIRVVRAFARHDFERDRFSGRNKAFRDNYYRLNKVMAIYWCASDFVATCQIGIVLIAGGVFLVEGSLTVGELFVFISQVSMVIWPIRHLGRVLTDSGKAVVALGRVDHILNSPEESVEPTPATGRGRGAITVTNLDFSYPNGQSILRNMSLSVAPGETVALVGPPGCGKTTFIRVLLRFYPYQRGQIEIDDLEINETDREWIRTQIGVVLQDPFLYAQTIDSNLRVGRPAAPHEDLLQASQDASLHESISKFANGYDTMVGERGVTLSGGQRQRVALARALLKDPPILVLDDSLSAVDTDTEHRILTALEQRRGRRTTLIVAHRLTTVRNADRILVMDNGCIVQQGSHQQLAEEQGPYRRLCEIQGALDESIRNDLEGLNRG
ncbi:MAG: ABC transporter ATP-binding protein/permease [Pseudomonadales bacterium]|nr:ABC transporter ATP-binding protein/permease [Pseudomonadales bacterium]